MKIQIGVLCLALAVSVRAHADSQKTAKQYVDAGLAAQKTRDYDTAVAMYQKAYDLVPTAVLLFNIAQAHRLAGRDSQAKVFYERYLGAEPKGPHAALARELLGEIDVRLAVLAKEAAEARVAAARAEADEKAAADAKARMDEEAREKAAADEAKRAERERADAERKQREQALVRVERGRPLRIAGIATACAGVASLGVGVFFGLRARSLSDELSANMAVYSQSSFDEGERAEKMSIVFTAVGGALVAGGLVTYYLGHRARESAPMVMVIANDEQLGIALVGRL
jgi:tetratricopeptide (TPR) repeat protein